MFYDLAKKKRRNIYPIAFPFWPVTSTKNEETKTGTRYAQAQLSKSWSFVYLRKWLTLCQSMEFILTIWARFACWNRRLGIRRINSKRNARISFRVSFVEKSSQLHKVYTYLFHIRIYDSNEEIKETFSQLTPLFFLSLVHLAIVNYAVLCKTNARTFFPIVIAAIYITAFRYVSDRCFKSTTCQNKKLDVSN